MTQTLDSRVDELTSSFGTDAGPTADQWRRMLSGPAATPITLINFFKLRAPDGLEAMMRYAAVSGPALERAGGHFLLRGAFETTFMGDDEDWDVVAIASYPDRDALLALHDDAAYRVAWKDRVAAVEKQRVLIAAG